MDFLWIISYKIVAGGEFARYRGGFSVDLLYPSATGNAPRFGVFLYHMGVFFDNFLCALAY